MHTYWLHLRSRANMRALKALATCTALVLLRLVLLAPEKSTVRLRPSLRSSLVVVDDSASLAPAPPQRQPRAERGVSAPIPSAARDTPAASSEATTATVAAQSGSRWRDRRAAAFAQYVSLQHAFMDPPAGAKSVRVPGLNNETRPLRYIVVNPCCQLCNRLRVLVSAVALGILTERAVVMDFDHGYYGRCASSPRQQPAPAALSACSPQCLQPRAFRFADLFSSPLAPLRGEPPKGVPGAGRAGRSLGWLHCMQGFLCDDPLSWTEVACNPTCPACNPTCTACNPTCPACNLMCPACNPMQVVVSMGSPSFLHSIWLNPKLRTRFTQACWLFVKVLYGLEGEGRG